MWLSIATHRSRVALAAARYILLAIHAAMLAWGGYIHSATIDEPAHLIAGLTNLQFGRFDLYKVNPPLVRMVAAVPVWLAGARPCVPARNELPGERSEFVLGEAFVAQNGERSIWLFRLARWACIPFSVCGGYVCFRWAKDLYGDAAGLLSLTLWCFSPNILGHGQLLTSDVAATGLGVAAGYRFWRWLRDPSWLNSLVAGAVLGLAELAKMTLLVYCALWPLIWLVYRLGIARAERHGRLQELQMMVVGACTCLCVINTWYGFEGTGTQLGRFRFVSKACRGSADVPGIRGEVGNRFQESCLSTVPIPLPRNYVLGIDLQWRDHEAEDRLSYLRGQFRARGSWYYYLYALSIKVPVGTWILCVLAIAARLWNIGRVSCWEEMVVLAPACAVLCVVTTQSGTNEQMRYVLPAFPFLFVWVSRVAANASEHLVVAAIAVVATSYSIASSILVFPHSLSYFNEFVGGPINGSAHLIESHIDWGQDLLLLRDWMAAHPQARPMNLVYFGRFDPRDIGIEYSVPAALLSDSPEMKPRVPSGWYALSVTLLRGRERFIYNGRGTKSYISHDSLAGFRSRHPVAYVGYSIYVFHIAED